LRSSRTVLREAGGEVPPAYSTNDEIDVSKPVLLEDGTPERYQRFFYEIVGQDMHTLSAQDNPYIDKKKLKFPGVVFSSGSDSWGHGIMLITFRTMSFCHLREQLKSSMTN
jgi:hypothetical protein